MIGTQLGWPGLVCFVAYAGLCLRSKNAKLKIQNEEGSKSGKRTEPRLGKSGKAETGEMQNAEGRRQKEHAGKAEGGKRESGNRKGNEECRMQNAEGRPEDGGLRMEDGTGLMEDGKSGEAEKGEDEDEPTGWTGRLQRTGETPVPLRIACRAGAVVFLAAFWFDGGLFTLATGAVFWVLLELGRDA